MLDNLFKKNAEDNCVLQRFKEGEYMYVRFKMSFKGFLSRNFTNFFLYFQVCSYTFCNVT